MLEHQKYNLFRRLQMTSINELRKKLEELKNKKSGGGRSSKINYWTPEVGKYSVRMLVPIEDFEQLKVIEQAIHYSIGPDSKQFTCNKQTFGTDCPICDKGREFWNLYNESVKEGIPKEALEEVRKAASGHTANKRYYVPVYVKETETVALWSLSEKNYEKILDIICTDEVDSFLDPKNGHDIKVDYSQESAGNRRTASWTFTPSMKKTPAVGGKEFDAEAYEALFAQMPTMDVTASDVDEMNKALDETGDQLMAEAAPEKIAETGTVVEKKTPAKTSKLHNVLSELKDTADDDEF